MSTMTTIAKHFGTIRMSVFCILLAFTLTACEDRDADTQQLGAGEVGGQEGMTRGTPVMNVSVTDQGATVPTVQAGRTTFAVSNTDTEDCMLTVTPQEDGEMEGRGSMGDGTMGGQMDQDAAPGAGQDADRETPMGDTETDAQSPTDRSETMPGQMMNGRQSSIVEAGQDTTVTMDLQPGLYEVSCNGEQGTTQPAVGMTQQGAGTPMLVKVTAEMAHAAGMHGGQDAAEPRTGEPIGPDTAGTAY